jgi:hypothetical protein
MAAGFDDINEFMKIQIAIATAALSCGLVGCINPVPSTKFSGTIGGQPFEFEGHKQTSVEKLALELNQGTNHFTLSIGKLSSVNDERVISKAYAGQAAVMKTAFDGANNLVSKMIEGGVKGASPAP